MPDATSSPVDNAARRLNRLGIGTLSAMQLVMVVLTLIALNYLTARHYTRVDLSRDGNYTLSQASTRYLASAALKGRSKPVKWIMAFRRTTPFYERVRALAEEYARLSRGKITIEVLDSIRSPDRTQQVMAAYELSLVRDMILSLIHI